MRVFVAGATGVLGRRLIAQLTERGHTAIGLARTPEKVEQIQSLGGEGRLGDLFDVGSLERAADGCQAVIRAATSIPTAMRPSAADWQMNDRIRRQGTEALAACAQRIGAKTFVMESIAWVARPADGSAFDESSPLNTNYTTQSAVDAERILAAAADRAGFTPVTLRCGLFYCHDAAHTKTIAEGLRRRMLPIIGDGTTIWSNLHAFDAAAAFVTAVEHAPRGVWHIVDDQPVSVNDYLGYFAQRLGAKPPWHVPVWLGRLLAGSLATSFFTQSIHTSSAPFQNATGWTPRYPTYRQGIDEIVAEWSHEKVLV